MPPEHLPNLSRRERQIMQALYARGRASAEELRDDLVDAPSGSAVRTFLRLLEDKGHVRHEKSGRKFVYSPVVPAETASRSALSTVLRTFFGGSVEQAMASLIDLESRQLDDADLDRLAALIDDARHKGTPAHKAKPRQTGRDT